MSVTRICLLMIMMVSFNVLQENETDALVSRLIEDATILAIDVGFKLVKFPIMVGGKVAWKCIKVPTKFVWSLAKIPFRVIIRLAWRIAKRPLKSITPKFLQDALRAEVEKYKLNKKLRKLRKSKIYRFKTAFKNKMNKWENSIQARKNKRNNRVKR